MLKRGAFNRVRQQVTLRDPYLGDVLYLGIGFPWNVTLKPYVRTNDAPFKKLVLFPK